MKQSDYRNIGAYRTEDNWNTISASSSAEDISRHKKRLAKYHGASSRMIRGANTVAGHI